MPADRDKDVPPQIRPDQQGANRGTGDEHDANRAGAAEKRGAATTEYAANGEPGRSGDEGYVEGGEVAGRAGDVQPDGEPGEG